MPTKSLSGYQSPSAAVSPAHHCAICRSANVERVPYDNHERSLNAAQLRHQLGAMLHGAGITGEWLSQRLLFSPVHDIVHCLQCGYGRYERAFAMGELERYYGRRYFLAGGLPPEQWDDFGYIDRHFKTRGQWAFVSPHLELNSKLRMLDIGAAASRMSRLIKRHLGDRVECSVVEPGDGWTGYYRHHGIRLAGRFFPCADDQQYHYVHTSHWLEHVDRLEPVLQGLRARTITGGLCFIEVPNCDNTYFARAFPDAPHIHFFTAASLCLAMRHHGFETVQVSECAMPNPEYFHFRRRTDRLTADERLLVEKTEASIDHVPGGSLLRGLFRAVG